jgi:hypothetical protein
MDFPQAVISTLNPNYGRWQRCHSVLVLKHWTMDSPVTPLPANPSNIATAATPRSFGSEVLFLACTYFVIALFGSFFIAACAPGCCYVFFSILAAASGLLMLRDRFGSRVICLVMLLLSLAGMWHEKEARSTWGEIALRRQIETLQAGSQGLKSQ